MKVISKFFCSKVDGSSEFTIRVYLTHGGLKICNILIKHWLMLEEKLFELHHDKCIFQLFFRCAENKNYQELEQRNTKFELGTLLQKLKV